jgi:hypothetical protein
MKRLGREICLQRVKACWERLSEAASLKRGLTKRVRTQQDEEVERLREAKGDPCQK